MAVIWLMTILALTSAVMADVESPPQTPGTSTPAPAIIEVLARIEARMTRMDSKITVGLQTLQRDIYGLENKLGYLVTMIQMMDSKLVFPEKMEALDSKVDDLSKELKTVRIISDENLNHIRASEKNIISVVNNSSIDLKRKINHSCEDTSRTDKVLNAVTGLSMTLEKLVNQSEESALEISITGHLRNLTNRFDRLEGKCLVEQSKIIQHIETKSQQQSEDALKLQLLSQQLLNRLSNASSGIESLQGGIQSQGETLDELSHQIRMNNNLTSATLIQILNTTCDIAVNNTLEELDRSIETLPVVCPASVPGQEIIFLNRVDGSVDFHRNWTEYKAGFGNLDGEFWLGLDCLNRITNTRQYGLRVDFRDWEGNHYQSRYSHISVGEEADGYKLSVSGYDQSSTGGDSLSNDNNRAFTTYDRDNDAYGGNCAVEDKGGWWYHKCHTTNPTGLYLTGGQIDRMGITWHGPKESKYSYKTMRFRLIPS